MWRAQRRERYGDNWPAATVWPAAAKVGWRQRQLAGGGDGWPAAPAAAVGWWRLAAGKPGGGLSRCCSGYASAWPLLAAGGDLVQLTVWMASPHRRC
jgi:hypothetical protein